MVISRKIYPSEKSISPPGGAQALPTRKAPRAVISGGQNAKEETVVMTCRSS